MASSCAGVSLMLDLETRLDGEIGILALALTMSTR